MAGDHGADVAAVRRRFLLFRALRWLPRGLLIPEIVLLMLDRGLSVGHIGLVAAAHGLMVLVLDLPSGGLADALGRRPVLIAATAVDAVAVLIFFFAHSVALFMLVFALQGVYRALDSGPLDAWYVDAALVADPDADIEAGLSAGGVAMGVAAAAGALLSAAIIATDPLPGVDAIAAPLLLVVLLRLIEIGAQAALLTEVRPAQGMGGPSTSNSRVSSIVGGSIKLVRGSPVLLGLVAVELFWGFGVASVEVLAPARIGEESGSLGTAAVVFAFASAGTWVVSATGSALVPLVTRSLGAPMTAAISRVVQGGFVVTMALLAGGGGLVVVYLVTYLVDGASRPVHQAYFIGRLGRRAAPLLCRSTR